MYDLSPSAIGDSLLIARLYPAVDQPTVPPRPKQSESHSGAALLDVRLLAVRSVPQRRCRRDWAARHGMAMMSAPWLFLGAPFRR